MLPSRVAGSVLGGCRGLGWGARQEEGRGIGLWEQGWRRRRATAPVSTLGVRPGEQEEGRPRQRPGAGQRAGVQEAYSKKRHRRGGERTVVGSEAVAALHPTARSWQKTDPQTFSGRGEGWGEVMRPHLPQSLRRWSLVGSRCRCWLWQRKRWAGLGRQVAAQWHSPGPPALGASCLRGGGCGGSGRRPWSGCWVQGGLPGWLASCRA